MGQYVGNDISLDAADDTGSATIKWRPSDGTYNRLSISDNPRGLLIGNGVSSDAADDTGNTGKVYVTAVPRDDSGALEQWNI